MNYCTNCGNKIETNENFCGKCGSLNYGEGSNFANTSLKTLKTIFINPVSFLRTSRSVNLQFTGVLLALIALMEFICTKSIDDFFNSILRGSGIFFKVFLISILFMLIKASSLFVFQKLIVKKDMNFLTLLNLTIYSDFIYYLIAFISLFIGSYILSFELVLSLIMFSFIFTSLLMYQCYKDLFKTDTKSCLISFCLSHCASLFIIITFISLLLN